MLPSTASSRLSVKTKQREKKCYFKASQQQKNKKMFKVYWFLRCWEWINDLWPAERSAGNNSCLTFDWMCVAMSQHVAQGGVWRDPLFSVINWRGREVDGCYGNVSTIHILRQNTRVKNREVAERPGCSCQSDFFYLSITFSFLFLQALKFIQLLLKSNFTDSPL